MSYSRALETLNEITTHNPSASAPGYQVEPTPGRWEVNRFVNNEPSWETGLIKSQDRPKTLIFTDWSVRFDTEDLIFTDELSPKKLLWEFLLAQKVECYVWTGKLTRVTDLPSLVKASNQVEILDHPEE